MNADWKDRLAALSGSLPEGEEERNAPAQPPSGEKEPRKPVIEITYERKGRGGKQATILSGFTCSDDELKELATRLKQRLATGGSARGGEILIQGDCRARVKQLLKEYGYPTKGC